MVFGRLLQIYVCTQNMDEKKRHQIFPIPEIEKTVWQYFGLIPSSSTITKQLMTKQISAENIYKNSESNNYN